MKNKKRLAEVITHFFKVNFSAQVQLLDRNRIFIDVDTFEDAVIQFSVMFDLDKKIVIAFGPNGKMIFQEEHNLSDDDFLFGELYTIGSEINEALVENPMA